MIHAHGETGKPVWITELGWPTAYGMAETGDSHYRVQTRSRIVEASRFDRLVQSDPELIPLYRRQVQTMREFETVVDQLVRVGEQLSDLAVAEVEQKKLLVELEQTAEVRRLVTALAARQTPDFEAWESLLLQAARQGGAGVLGRPVSKPCNT
jgi:hypothetical protein